MYYIFVKITFFAFFILKINTSCPEGSVEWPLNQNESCYFFKSNSSGFAAAQLLCAEMKGNLALIHDGFANSLLAQEGKLNFRESTVTDFWIGLTNLMSYGNWTWMDNTPLDFTDWASGEPQNMTDNNCASLSMNDGRWRYDDCFKEKPFVCKIDAKYFDPTTTTTQYPIYANCSNNFTYFQPTHSCYGVGNWTDPANWTQAEEYCEAFGAHLSSIHSYDELQFLEALHWIAQAGLWTGAFSNDGGISWKWSDGSSWGDYNSWGVGYPKVNTSACGALWMEGLTDEDCSDSLRIVCKTEFK